MLQILEFKTNNSNHKQILLAVNFIKDNLEEKDKYYSAFNKDILQAITKNWKPFVLEGKKKLINKLNFEIAVLEQLRD